jgi:hypothetical protein
MATIKELETMTYTEYINPNHVYKIVQNWDNIFKELPESRQQKIQNSIAEGIDPLISLKKIVKQKKEVVYTQYKFSKALKTSGRLFAQNPSLSNLPREFRNSIAGEMYYDVDMRNCHPEILKQYCMKREIPCDYLQMFVKNREKILADLCERNFGMDCDTAKQTVLSIINGGKGAEFKDDPFLLKFREEMKNVHTVICRMNIDTYENVQKRKVDNIKGKTVNIVLCREEHKILIHSVKYMREQGYSVDVLVFDGFMVRKNKPLTPEVLGNLQAYIKDKLNYDMEFVEKSMTSTIDLSKYPDPIDARQESTYHRDKEEFEKNHVKIMYPPMFVATDNDNLILQNETNCIASHKHLKTTVVNDKGKSVRTSFIHKWICDEHIRLYRNLVFIPPPASYDLQDYNSWRDFTQEKIELPDNFDADTNTYIKEFREFIANLFGDVKENIDFFIAWCANIIQNPSKRSSVCMVLYSMEEGAGKNMIIKTIEKCIGECYVNYISDVGNQLFGKHAAAEMNKLLIVLNEVKGKDTYANTDLFKTRITDDKREVELKGKDMIQINNYANYVINTNNVNMVNAGDNDRRFCVLDCNNKKLADKLYFKNYEDNVNQNSVAIRCIYEYLKTFNIPEIVPDLIFSNHRPKTELYKDLVDCNKEKEWDFLEHFVRNTHASTDKATITNDKLWTAYKQYCSNNNYDIDKLNCRRFQFIFNRIVVKRLTDIDEYKTAIDRTTFSNERARIFNFEKLRKYFKIDKNDINLFHNDSDSD